MSVEKSIGAAVSELRESNRLMTESIVRAMKGIENELKIANALAGHDRDRQTFEEAVAEYQEYHGKVIKALSRVLGMRRRPYDAEPTRVPPGVTLVGTTNAEGAEDEKE